MPALGFVQVTLVVPSVPVQANCACADDGGSSIAAAAADMAQAAVTQARDLRHIIKFKKNNNAPIPAVRPIIILGWTQGNLAAPALSHCALRSTEFPQKELRGAGRAAGAPERASIRRPAGPQRASAQPGPYWSCGDYVSPAKTSPAREYKFACEQRVQVMVLHRLQNFSLFRIREDSLILGLIKARPDPLVFPLFPPYLVFRSGTRTTA